ncbi:hypothetical protein COBT_000424 [Conglomerata obtusa]
MSMNKTRIYLYAAVLVLTALIICITIACYNLDNKTQNNNSLMHEDKQVSSSKIQLENLFMKKTNGPNVASNNNNVINEQELDYLRDIDTEETKKADCIDNPMNLPTLKTNKVTTTFKNILSVKNNFIITKGKQMNKSCSEKIYMLKKNLCAERQIKSVQNNNIIISKTSNTIIDPKTTKPSGFIWDYEGYRNAYASCSFEKFENVSNEKIQYKNMLKNTKPCAKEQNFTRLLIGDKVCYNDKICKKTVSSTKIQKPISTEYKEHLKKHGVDSNMLQTRNSCKASQINQTQIYENALDCDQKDYNAIIKRIENITKTLSAQSKQLEHNLDILAYDQLTTVDEKLEILYKEEYYGQLAINIKMLYIKFTNLLNFFLICTSTLKDKKLLSCCAVLRNAFSTFQKHYHINSESKLVANAANNIFNAVNASFEYQIKIFKNDFFSKNDIDNQDINCKHLFFEVEMQFLMLKVAIQLQAEKLQSKQAQTRVSVYVDTKNIYSYKVEQEIIDSDATITL